MLRQRHFPGKAGVPGRRGLGASAGAVLVVVLGMLFILTVLVTMVMETIERQLRTASIEYARTELRTTAYSAFQTTLAVLAEFRELDGGLYSYSQGWRYPLEYANLEWPEGITVKVTVTDESAKIPLNESSVNLLKLLFAEMGLNLTDSDMLIDTLMDWMDSDDLARLQGAERDYYERLDSPVEPADGPLDRFDTLRFIKGYRELFFDEVGRPNEYFQSFQEAVSLHNTRTVNINNAEGMVLAVLAESLGFDQSALEEYLAGADRIRWNADDPFIRNREELIAAGINSTQGVRFRSEILRVEVEAGDGDMRFTLNALLRLEGQGPAGGGNNNQAPRQGLEILQISENMVID